METAVNYTYDIPSSHSRSSDCIELDFKLDNHNKHKEMLFSPINHTKPEKWLSAVENFSNEIHHRAFSLPPVSLLGAQSDVTSSSALNGLQAYSKKFQDLPHINGYDPKIVLGGAELLPMKQELLTNGRNFSDVFSASTPLTVPGKKKKGRPKKQAVAGSLSELPGTVVKDEATRASAILNVDEYSNLSSTKVKKNSSSKEKESEKNAGQNKSISSNDPITNGIAVSRNEEQSPDLIPPQISSAISPMSHMVKSGSKDDETTFPSCKGSKKNPKSPAKRKAPKTIVRDSYKKSKHKSKAKTSRNCSVDSTSQLRDQFFLDKRRIYEPTSLHGGSHGYLAHEYMQQYISAELYEQYIKTGEPNFHHPGRATNFENAFNRSRSEGLSLRHDLEPGEVLRLESDAAASVYRDSARYSSHLPKDNAVSSDLLYIYYSKFYETFHQLALQQGSKQDGSAFSSLGALGSTQVPSSHMESSNSSHDEVCLSEPCSLENGTPGVHTTLGVQNGGLSVSEKRKFPELQISQAFDDGNQRRKRQCTSSSHGGEENVNGSSSHNEESTDTNKILLEVAGESNEKSGIAQFPTSVNGVSSETANELDTCKEISMKTTPVDSADLVSKNDQTVMDSPHLEEGKYKMNDIIVHTSGNGDAENDLQSVDNLFGASEKDCVAASIDAGVTHLASDNAELQAIGLTKSKEAFPYIPLKKILSSLADESKESEVSDLSVIETKTCEASLDLEANAPLGSESPSAVPASLANLQFNLTTKINFIKLLQALSASSDQTGVSEKSEPCMRVEELPLVDPTDLIEDKSVSNKVEKDQPGVETQYIGPILKVPTVDAISLLVSSSKMNSHSSEVCGNSNASTSVPSVSSAELSSAVDNNVLDAVKLTSEKDKSIEDKPVPSTESCFIASLPNQEGSTFQSRLSSRSSSVCTDELFEKDDSDELQKQFDELALTAEEHEQVEKIEWRMWMERLAGTSLEFLVKDDPPKISNEDQDQDDIDEILKNVRETISIQKQELEEKKRLEKEQMLARCLEADLKNESCGIEDAGIKSDGGEDSELAFSARDTLSNSDFLSLLSKRGFLVTNTAEEADDLHLEDNKDNVETSQPPNSCLPIPQTENKEELIVSTLGWAEPDDSRPLSSAHMLHWSYCRMTNHLLDPTRESFKCPLCSYKSPRKGHVERHILIHSGEKPYSCSECSYRSHTKDAMALHARVHSGHKKFVCCRCSYATNRKIYLERHLALHDDDDFSSPCSKCSDKTFIKKRGSRLLDAGVGGSAESSSIRGDFDVPVESDTDCEETSPLPSEELENNNNYTHLLANVKEEYDGSGLPDDFTLCGCQLFSTKASDRKKGRVYSADRPYPCSQCSYRATKKSLLDKHAKVHTGERPFPCPLCKYKASRKAHLLRHMRTHQKELE